MRPDRRTRVVRLAAAAVLSADLLLAWLSLAPMVRALAALILVFVPGYLLAWPVLRPRLGSAGAFAIAGGLSIGMVALGGLVLNLLPLGVQAATWLAYLFVLLVISLAFGRRPWFWRPKLMVHAIEVVLAGIGVMLILTAFILARSFAGYPTEAFTQLSIAPAAGAPASSVELRVRNEERVATSYRLEVWRDGVQVRSFAPIRLASGGTWSGTVSVGSGQIEARLFLATDPATLYRHVTLQVSGAAPSAAGQGASP